ncbi:MAG: NAD(P)/FAD-dependent oxidoreductase [Bacillota bacterium]|nr:NAD(P)/FAD-dependent oxidoreductase [Bacillota bacterium]
MDKVNTLIIGAGVIGLAVAAELSAGSPGSYIVVMEQHESFGRETSSRNSEVIHAGIYYPRGTLKARLCVEGKELLYSLCEKWSVPYRRTGKLIVANTPEESASLDDLLSQAVSNGVDDLEDLAPAQISRLEPHIKAERALFSPSTGILDSHTLMDRLEYLAQQNGVLMAYCHQVKDIEKLSDSYRITFQNPDGSLDTIDCINLVNSAGLQADQVASLAGIDIDQAAYRQHYCKGEYFSLPSSKASLVNHLVYPPPLHELTGLGIHLTKSLDGRLLLGPNTIYTDEPEYKIELTHAADFYSAVKPFFPFIEPNDPEPDMAGIRPKLSGPGEPFRDFIITEESSRGLPGLINLLGMESPGLTCCLSIARQVRKLQSE